MKAHASLHKCADLPKLLFKHIYSMDLDEDFGQNKDINLHWICQHGHLMEVLHIHVYVVSVCIKCDIVCMKNGIVCMKNGIEYLTLIFGETPKQVFLETVKTQMKCSVMLHFIRVYIVCKGKKYLQTKENIVF